MAATDDNIQLDPRVCHSIILQDLIYWAFIEHIALIQLNL